MDMDIGMKVVGVLATTMSAFTKTITATTLTRMDGDMAMVTSVSGSALTYKKISLPTQRAQDEPFFYGNQFSSCFINNASITPSTMSFFTAKSNRSFASLIFFNCSLVTNNAWA